MHRLKIFTPAPISLFSNFHAGTHFPKAYAVRFGGARPATDNVRFKSDKFDQAEGGSQEPKIRSNFPESWLFDSIDDVGNGTEYV